MAISSAPELRIPYPIRFGTSEEFLRLRKELVRLGFVQENMAGHFHLRQISEAQFEVDAKGDEVPAYYRLLTALFLQGKSVDGQPLRQAVGEATFDLFQKLGLLERYGAGERYAATVTMYETNGLYIVSDRSNPSLFSTMAARMGSRSPVARFRSCPSISRSAACWFW